MHRLDGVRRRLVSAPWHAEFARDWKHALTVDDVVLRRTPLAEHRPVAVAS